MYAATTTKLSLSRWAEIMGIHALHFAGVDIPGRLGSLCSQSFYQYDWQGVDAVSREEIARAIAGAEDSIERFLNHRLVPSWEVDELVISPRPFRTELVNREMLNSRSYPVSLQLSWGHVISGGKRTLEALELASGIVWTDTDGDGYFETGTVTVTVAEGLAPCEVHAYYPGTGGAPAWEIRPIDASVSGVTLTVVLRRELVVQTSITETIIPDYPLANGLSDADFLDEVDIYRVYNAPDDQVSFQWEPTRECACLQDGCAACSYATQPGCFVMRDAELGSIAPAPGTWADGVFTAAGWALPRYPDMARVWYYGGYQDRTLDCPRIEMSVFLATTVAILAAARLDRDPCSCRTDYFQRWRDDLSFQRGAGELASYKVTNRLLSNPFGTRRGEIEAWRRVTSMHKLGVGVGAVAVR